jgi:hypothetical protein
VVIKEPNDRNFQQPNIPEKTVYVKREFNAQLSAGPGWDVYLLKDDSRKTGILLYWIKPQIMLVIEPVQVL